MQIDSLNPLPWRPTTNETLFFVYGCRRYRDKEPSTAPVTTTPRATTPSESKKSTTINVTVNPKSMATTNVATKPAKITAKKIDMGAATNFGRDEIGINSPTHRNTHAEEDLFATNNVIVTAPVATTTAAANKADLLEDIFKTCSSTNDLPSETVSPQSNTNDDFFNPREDESQEFGDFASAFGTGASTVPATAVAQQAVPSVLPSVLPEPKKNDFADFSAAFTSSSNQTLSNSNDPANLLFAINTTPNAQITTSNSNQKVGDLLSDLDGLSLNVSAPTGKSSITITYSLSILSTSFFYTHSPSHLPFISKELKKRHPFRVAINLRV